MPRWTLIVLAGLLLGLSQPTAWAQGNSVLIPNEPSGSTQVSGKNILESVFWGTDRLSQPERQYGYEMDSASYGYPLEQYGFRPEDEYGAEEDGQYGYEMTDEEVINLQMYQ